MTSIILVNFVRYCYHDGPGFRTVVNFKGCPLRCAWCHSPHSWSFSPILWYDRGSCIGCEKCISQCPKGAIVPSNSGTNVEVDFSACEQCMLCTTVCPTRSLRSVGEIWDVDVLVERLLRDKTLFEKTGGGVTLSGGECLAQLEGALELLRTLHDQGVHNVVDTCGAVPRKNLKKVVPVTDLFLFDVKVLNQEQHKKFTGVSNIEILENLNWLAQSGAEIKVRSPIVPGVNDTPLFKEELVQLCDRLSIEPPEFLPFNPHTADRYEKIGIPFIYPKLIEENDSAKIHRRQ